MSTKKIQILGSFGSNIEVDSTLTQVGKAADAKATGDAINKVQTNIDDVVGLVENLDNKYYTESEIDGMMSDLNATIDSKSDVDHVHDGLYYTETEIDDKLDAMQSAIDSKVDIVEGMGLSTNDYTTSEKDKLESVEANANFYEHPVYDSHSSGLYKVTVDEFGHVSEASLVEKEDIIAFVEKDDILALGIPDKDAIDEEMSDLSDRIDGVENSINTTNEALEGVAQEFESYKTTNNEAVSTNASGIEANKTAIEAIQNDYLTSTNKEQLEDEISKVSEKATANASAIEILNGEGDGSVKQSIDNAFNEFAANVTNDDVVNTYKELIDYAAKHGPEFTKLVGKVDTIDTHVGEVETDLSNYKITVSEQFTEVDTTINNHTFDEKNPHNVTKVQIGLDHVDNTSDMDKPISHAVDEALQGKADAEHTHEIGHIDDLQNLLDDLQVRIDTNAENVDTKADLEHNHNDLYYDKDEILGLITVEDIDDICALDYSDGEGIDPVTAATKYWVERYYQPKGDYLTEADITAHNVSTSSHNDIRLLIENLGDDLHAIANSDDETLDQMREVVDYIKNNKSLIDGITIKKVNVSDIVDDLITNVSNKPLSAAQGVALKRLIDAIVVPTKVSELTNDSGYLTSYTETDPTVPAWAKASTKPTYTKSEVGLENVDNVKQYSESNPPPYPITRVNGKHGDVHLYASDVMAVSYVAQYLTETEKANARYNIGAGTSNVEIASDLTSSGKAADAKVVGDELVHIKEQLADLLYEPITISSFTIDNVILESGATTKGLIELGSTVTSVTLNWETSKTPKTLTLDGVSMDTSLTTHTYSNLNLIDTKTYNLKVTDERDTRANKSTALTFCNRVCYGVATAPEIIDSDFVMGLTTKNLATSRANSGVKYNAGGGQYLWYCVPTRLGECSFIDVETGLGAGLSLEATIDVVNASGYEESYYVYKSDYAGLGSLTVKVS